MNDTTIDTNARIDRFNDKWIPEPMSGCWLWTARLDKQGYGQLGVDGKIRSAHRVSWELFRGPIPEGLCVCHACDNPACVNPGHLWIGTVADNNADMVAKGRSNRGEKHGSAKLTEVQVITIRKDPRSQRKIAADYGVAQTTIGMIKRRIYWTHIPEQEVSK